MLKTLECALACDKMNIIKYDNIYISFKIIVFECCQIDHSPSSNSFDEKR